MEGDRQSIFKDKQLFWGLIAGIGAVIVVGVIIIGVAILVRGKSVEPANTADNSNSQQQTITTKAPTTAKVTAPGISTFSMKKGAKICKEGGKPVVYLFSTTWCPHCKWIKDTFDSTMAKYVQEGKILAYHWEMDTGDNTLTSAVEKQAPADAQAVYAEFNPKGSIPTFVFGCKYFRVGNGYEAKSDLVSEAKEFEAVIKDMVN